MRLLLWLPALSLNLLGCASTPPPVAPAEIPPPPVALASPCPALADLPEGATGQDLAAWAGDWIAAFGCERSKRAGLLEAWPR